ncbi:MAG: hypothetical protein ACHQEB_04775 [Chitinophagales bacterium]
MKYKSKLAKYFNAYICAAMMRHFFALLLLVSHINVSMFIAQVDEVDTYDAKGKPLNDINTLTEYIHDVLLHKQGKPRPDEDDDNARYFQVSVSSLYDFQQNKIKTSSEDLGTNNIKEYSLFKENKWLSPVLEITSPPPKA